MLSDRTRFDPAAARAARSWTRAGAHTGTLLSSAALAASMLLSPCAWSAADSAQEPASAVTPDTRSTGPTPADVSAAVVDAAQGTPQLPALLIAPRSVTAPQATPVIPAVADRPAPFGNEPSGDQRTERSAERPNDRPAEHLRAGASVAERATARVDGMAPNVVGGVSHGALSASAMNGPLATVQPTVWIGRSGSQMRNTRAAVGVGLEQSVGSYGALQGATDRRLRVVLAVPGASGISLEWAGPVHRQHLPQNLAMADAGEDRQQLRLNFRSNGNGLGQFAKHRKLLRVPVFNASTDLSLRLRKGRLALVLASTW